MGIAASFLLALSIHLVTVAQERLALVQSARIRLEKQVEERKKAERELEKQALLLESSNADLREFAYVTSHDLQEPLRTITSFATMLSRRYKGRLDTDADEFLEFITDGATRMSGMIQALLLYSRVVNAAEATEAVPVAEVVEWAKSNLATAIEESSAAITFDGLPMVRGSRVQLGQLFQNLIGNALKYKSGRPPAIVIACERQDRVFLFSVADNGIGVAPEHRERVFGLFKRLHGHQYPGTGIGLAICKRIVQRHGGRIWMESEAGSGSTVFFTLPAVQADP
jgi:light-regulated signal transduction histidine kinase (bacteriophytochrome)